MITLKRTFNDPSTIGSSIILSLDDASLVSVVKSDSIDLKKLKYLLVILYEGYRLKSRFTRVSPWVSDCSSQTALYE
jgi:hypothetical protein